VSYWRAFHHVVWGTKNREFVIVDGLEDVVERSIRHTCRQLEVRFHAIGIMPDHIHLVCSIPPRHAPAEVMRQVKSYSTRLINDSNWFRAGRVFFWQPEYGLLTFAEDALPRIVAYAENQLEHHRLGNLLPQFERTDNLATDR